MNWEDNASRHVAAKRQLGEGRWDKILKSVHEKYGSWNTRKGYKTWEFKEVKV